VHQALITSHFPLPLPQEIRDPAARHHAKCCSSIQRVAPSATTSPSSPLRDREKLKWLRYRFVRQQDRCTTIHPAFPRPFRSASSSGISSGTSLALGSSPSSSDILAIRATVNEGAAGMRQRPGSGDGIAAPPSDFPSPPALFLPIDVSL